MDYVRDGVSAKKAWFIFNDQIVCLGAGITSITGIPVSTSVNQSFLNGDVIVKTSSEKVLPAESSESLSPRWILHDGAGYYFPNGGNIKLETKTVTGSWNRVALMYKDEPIKAGIFKLWFEHGANLAGQTYAYCIVPQATKTKMQQMEVKPTFTILNNDANIQSVISADENLGGVIFYKAGKSKLFGGIDTDQPCVLMVKREGNRLAVSISDPTQKLAKIRLILDGKYKTSSAGITASYGQNRSEFILNLPFGDDAGKTVSLQLTKEE